jgi:hypothetical protein
VTLASELYDHTSDPGNGFDWVGGEMNLANEPQSHTRTTWSKSTRRCFAMAGKACDGAGSLAPTEDRALCMIP